MKNKTDTHHTPETARRNLVDLLAMPDADEVEFEPPKLTLKVKPAEDLDPFPDPNLDPDSTCGEIK